MSIQRQLEAIARRSTEKAAKVVRMSIFDVSSRISIRSPVDTGQFRFAWKTGVNAIDNKGNGTVGVLAPDFKIGDEVFFVNSLPYAKGLEDGNSEQAPHGMVKLSVAEFDSIAQGYINRFGD